MRRPAPSSLARGLPRGTAPRHHPWRRALAIGTLAGLTAFAPVALAGGGGGAGGKLTADALPGEILLVLRDGNAVTPLLTRYGLSIVGRFGARPIFRLRVVGGADTAATITALQAEPGVVVAEPNFRHGAPESVKNNVWAAGTPQAYAAQWAGTALGLAAAQRSATGAGVRIAVMDTGFDLHHPALAGRWLPGHDFVDGDDDPSETALPTQGGYGHGTHVAGLVALAAPGAKLMPLRVLDNDGGGNAWVLAEALLHAVDPDHNPDTADGAQVINLSMAGLQRTRLMATLGQLLNCQPPAPGDPLVDLGDAGYEDDRRRCGNQGGTLVVVGAGNNGSNSLKTYPASESAYGLVSVAASAANGKLAGFSNSGNWITLAAPGDAITSTVPGGGYGTWSGTSMATPLVAGVAALMLQMRPQMAPKDVLRCLASTTRPLGGTVLRQVDAGAALSAMASRGRDCR